MAGVDTMNLHNPKRILVAYDFSSRARKAFKRADALARRIGAVVEAVHVRDWLNPDGSTLPSLTPKIREALEAAMARDLPGASWCGVVEGSTEERLLELVRVRGADLLILPA